MNLPKRTFLFLLILLWFAGIWFECFVHANEKLIYFYPFVKQSYSLVCHQDQKKIIELGECRSLVCARCAGIYLSALILSFVFLFKQPKQNLPIKYFLFFAILMLADVIFSSVKIYTYSKTIAMATGILFGSVLFIYFYNGLNFLFMKTTNRK